MPRTRAADRPPDGTPPAPGRNRRAAGARADRADRAAPRAQSGPADAVLAPGHDLRLDARHGGRRDRRSLAATHRRPAAASARLLHGAALLPADGAVRARRAARPA